MRPLTAVRLGGRLRLSAVALVLLSACDAMDRMPTDLPETRTASVDGSDPTLEVERIPKALRKPARGALWTIPVVIVRILPTRDGVTLDEEHAHMSGTLEDTKNRIGVLEERVKFMLEEGSRFRGYRGNRRNPSLGYRVVHIVTIYGYFERGPEVPWNPGHYFPDQHQILSRVDAERWVNRRGVKEFWIWGYDSDEFDLQESNMSSPLSGDISNSARFQDDLPLYDHTYTVYEYNFARSQAEAVHDHGHQLEALLSHVDGNLFWREFVGRKADDTSFSTGRAGWTHMPPNTTEHYDYVNPTEEPSDIADWRPGGGRLSNVSMATWGNVPYKWPAPLAPGETEISQRIESQWYIYWMQSMPGRGNKIPHRTGTMTNWWRFTGDWDGAIRDATKLSTLVPRPITIRNDFAGSVGIMPGGELQPGQSVTLESNDPMTVSVWECVGPAGCDWDPYVLEPGQAYHVVSDPDGPSGDLAILEL